MKFAVLVLVASLFAECYSKPGPATRVVGGTLAEKGQFPYQASLRYLGSHTCGCSIIALNFVLTAAHCVWRRAVPADFSVYTGSLSVTGGVPHSVRSICIHPAYTNDQEKAYQNDVGVIMLEDDVVISADTAIIPMASREYYRKPGVAAVASGWGATVFRGPVAPELLYVYTGVLTPEQCKANWEPTTDTQICTLAKEGQGICQGDSGGPLVVGGELYGTVSASPVPCANGKADIFFNVYQFGAYIDQAMSQMTLNRMGVPGPTCPTFALPGPRLGGCPA